MTKEKVRPQRLLVCRRCGRMWEPNAGSRRPQCSECKSTSKRPAEEAEINAYMRGERRSPLHGDSAGRTESDPEPEPDTGGIQVDQVDIEALIGDAPGPGPRDPTPEPARRTGVVLVGTIVALVAVGSLVGWFLVSRRDRQRTQRSRERVEEVAEELPGERGLYTMPGAPAAFG